MQKKKCLNLVNTDPKFYDTTHKKAINKMEDEIKGALIVEFVQLNS